MNVKTIIAIALAVFMVGAAIWLNIRNRKKYVTHEKQERGRQASRPLSVYGGMQ